MPAAKPVPYTKRMSICLRCGEAKKNEQFVVRDDSGREKHAEICVICRENHAGEMRLTFKDDQSRTAVKTLVAGLRGKKIQAPHVTELCDQIVQEFGGLGNLVKEWKKQIDVAINERPGTKTVLDSFKTIKDLITQSTEHRGSAPDVADLSDADLERELQETFVRVHNSIRMFGPEAYEPGDSEPQAPTEELQHAERELLNV